VLGVKMILIAETLLYLVAILMGYKRLTRAKNAQQVINVYRVVLAVLEAVLVLITFA
jgi:hypothetical protein